MSWIQLVILACATATGIFGKRDEFVEQRFFDPIYQSGKRKSDTNSLPFQRETQLYSRNSREHIRILQSRKVDAKGKDGDKYAKLIIESDNFGRVRIRGAATNYYLCIDKKNRLRSRVRGRNKDNCIFLEHFADNAFTEFTSVKYKTQYIAFNRRGLQRAGHKTRSGMKAVQFIERPVRVPVSRLYRGRKYNKNDQKGHKVRITIKNWKKWKKWLKWRRQQRKLREKQKKESLIVTRVRPTQKPRTKKRGKDRGKKTRRHSTASPIVTPTNTSTITNTTSLPSTPTVRIHKLKKSRNGRKPRKGKSPDK